MGFEPTIPISQDKRLAGARTRPLCDPSHTGYMLSNGPRHSNTRLNYLIGHRNSDSVGMAAPEAAAVLEIIVHIQVVSVRKTPGGMLR